MKAIGFRQHGLVLIVVLASVLAFLAVACDTDDGDVEEGAQTGADSGALDEPEDLDVLPPELPGTGDTGSAVGRPSCSATEALSWNAAKENVGSEVTLIGPVFEVSESDSGVSVVIGSSEVAEEDRVEVVLTENALDNIEGDPVELYSDSQVCAVGVVQRVDGNLQMVVNESGDIQRL